MTASAEVARLHVSISAKMDELNQGMQGLSSKLQSVGSKVSGAGMKLTKGLTAPIMAAGGAALALANKYASMGDHIAKTATKLGVSTDALQELDYWAGQNGISSGSMERAVGRLNQRIGRAVQGNEKYSEAFKNLGVEITDSNGKIKATEAVLGDTIAALRSIEDPAMQSAMAAEVFGTKMARDLMPALQDGSLSIEEAKEKIHELGGVMSEDAARASEQYTDAMDDLKRSFGGVWMSLANQLIPIVVNKLIPALQEHVIPLARRLAEAVGRLIEWFGNLNPTLQKVIGIIVGLAVAIGPVLVVAGKLIGIIGAVVGVLSAKIIIIGLVIAGIIAFIAWIVNLIRNNEAMMEKLSAAWEYIRAVAEEIWGAVAETIAVVVEVIKTVVTAALDYIKAFWDKWGAQILGVIQPIWAQIQNVITTVINLVKNIIQLVLAIIRGDWSAAWEHILEIGRTLGNFIKNTLENIFTALYKALKLAWEMMRETALAIWQRIRDGVVQRAQALREGIISTINAALAWIKALPSQALQWGRDIIQGLINGVRNMAGNLAGAIRGVVDSAVNSVKNFLGIRSPSALFEDEVGFNIGEGLAKGIVNTGDRIKGALEDITSPANFKLPSLTQEVSLAGVGSLSRTESGPRTVQVTANYHVTDKATAEHANNDLVRKLQDRGLGGAYR